MKFSIDKNVPQPKSVTVGVSIWKDIPLKEMSSGDSICIKKAKTPIDRKEYMRTYSSLYGFISARGMRNSFKIKLINNDCEIRIWKK
jgi:hypothetical protein